MSINCIYWGPLLLNISYEFTKGKKIFFQNHSVLSIFINSVFLPFPPSKLYRATCSRRASFLCLPQDSVQDYTLFLLSDPQWCAGPCWTTRVLFVTFFVSMIRKTPTIASSKPPKWYNGAHCWKEMCTTGSHKLVWADCESGLLYSGSTPRFFVFCDTDIF